MYSRSLGFLFLVLVLAIPGWRYPDLHVPHDGTFSVACAPLPGGGYELVITANNPCFAMRSRDGGLTWDILAGEGLERTTPRHVVWWPNGGAPLFVIGTAKGVWSYDPATGAVQSFMGGIPSNDSGIRALAAPLASSDGPVIASTAGGNLYRRLPGASSWERVLQSGLHCSVGIAPVAISPYFDTQAPVGASRAMVAAFRGVLYLSMDGGENWLAQDQFDEPASCETEWTITALALAEDFAATGSVVLGRGKASTTNPQLTEGEIWRSADFGASFVRVSGLGAAVTCLYGTPPGPSGNRYFLLQALDYPDTRGMRGVGVLRSEDGGLTWNDFGNEQDFFRTGCNDGTALSLDARLEQGFVASPDFPADGTLYMGRAEGLHRSRDEGVHWIAVPIREVEESRDVAVARTGDGDMLAFSAKYGGTVIRHNLTTDESELLRLGAPMAYVQLAEASPNFAHDGTVFFGGGRAMVAWYDPSAPVANPFNATGWLELPVLPLDGARWDGIPLSMAVSPHYDGSQLPGTDLHVYWDSLEDKPMRTLDGGQTMERIGYQVDGKRVDQLWYMKIAPTYDGSTPEGRTDVYGAGTTGLFRLEGDRWRKVWDAGQRIEGLAIDPGFSRPDNPRLFLGLQYTPHVVEFLDHPGAPQIIPRGEGIEDVRLFAIHVPPDFGVRPVVYALSWGTGIHKLDLQGGWPLPEPRWQPLGAPWPGWRCNKMRISPEFADDRTLFACSGKGLAAVQDQPGSSWSLSEQIPFQDDRNTNFVPYQPLHPLNPAPDRPWHWVEVSRTAFINKVGIDDLTDRRVEMTRYDGSYLTARGRARSLVLHTFEGKRISAVSLQARSLHDGNLIASTQVDLDTGGPIAARDVALDLGDFLAVEVRVEVIADPGEVFATDGMSFLR